MRKLKLISRIRIESACTRAPASPTTTSGSRTIRCARTGKLNTAGAMGRAEGATPLSIQLCWHAAGCQMRMWVIMNRRQLPPQTGPRRPPEAPQVVSAQPPLDWPRRAWFSASRRATLPRAASLAAISAARAASRALTRSRRAWTSPAAADSGSAFHPSSSLWTHRHAQGTHGAQCRREATCLLAPQWHLVRPPPWGAIEGWQCTSKPAQLSRQTSRTLVLHKAVARPGEVLGQPGDQLCRTPGCTCVQPTELDLQVEKGEHLKIVAKPAVADMGVEPWRCTSRRGNRAGLETSDTPTEHPTSCATTRDARCSYDNNRHVCCQQETGRNADADCDGPLRHWMRRRWAICTSHTKPRKRNDSMTSRHPPSVGSACRFLIYDAQRAMHGGATE